MNKEALMIAHNAREAYSITGLATEETLQGTPLRPWRRWTKRERKLKALKDWYKYVVDQRGQILRC